MERLILHHLAALHVTKKLFTSSTRSLLKIIEYCVKKILKMRVPTQVFAYKTRDARAPQKEHLVPFQEILPLRLKERVSGKADSSNDVACLQEMGVLFACLKGNEFEEKYCNKEIQNFQKCYKTFADAKFEAKKTVNQGIITPGKNLNYKQLNKYMRRYPNPQ